MRKFYWLLLGFLTLAVILLIERNGMRHFGGMDHSVMIAVSWNMLNGLMPYRDFYCTLPPGFYLVSTHAFQWLGVHWSSFVHVAALWGGGSFLLQVYLSHQCRMEKWVSLGFAFCCQVLTFVYIAFWWYNPYTVSACLLLYFCVAAYVINPEDKVLPVIMTLLAAVLALGKPNLAAPMLLGACGVSFLASKKWSTWLLCWAGAVVLALGFLAIHGINPLDMIASYISVAVSRGLTNIGFRDVSLLERRGTKVMILLAATFLALAWTALAKGRSQSRSIPWRWIALDSSGMRLMALHCCVIACGAYAAWTNMESKYEDMSLLFAPMIFIYGRHLKQPHDVGIWLHSVCRASLLLVLGLSANAFYLGLLRYRVQLIGYGMFFEKDYSPEAVNNEFFGSIKTGKRFPLLIKQLGSVLASKPPAARVYFGPRMEFAYAAFKIAPPRNLPLWWQPGAGFGLKEQPKIVENWKAAEFGILVFLKDDFTYIPENLVDFIRSTYVEDMSFSELSVFHRK